MQKQYTFTTQKQLREEFWSTFPEFQKRGNGSQNQQSADVRMTFVDWIDQLERSGEISEGLASRATL